MSRFVVQNAVIDDAVREVRERIEAFCAKHVIRTVEQAERDRALWVREGIRHAFMGVIELLNEMGDQAALEQVRALADDVEMRVRFFGGDEPLTELPKESDEIEVCGCEESMHLRKQVQELEAALQAAGELRNFLPALRANAAARGGPDIEARDAIAKLRAEVQAALKADYGLTWEQTLRAAALAAHDARVFRAELRSMVTAFSVNGGNRIGSVREATRLLAMSDEDRLSAMVDAGIDARDEIDYELEKAGVDPDDAMSLLRGGE